MFLYPIKVSAMTDALASFFVGKWKMKPQENLSLYSKNRMEWLISCMAAEAGSNPTVAIYDTFGDDNVEVSVHMV